MPQLQTITLLDREATPVSHVFTPRDVVDGVGTCARYTGLMIGEEIFTVSSRRSGGKLRVKYTTKVPVVQTETINGVSSPKILREGFAVTEYIFADTSLEQERKNLIGMHQSAADPSKLLVNDAAVKGEGVYR